MSKKREKSNTGVKINKTWWGKLEGNTKEKIKKGIFSKMIEFRRSSNRQWKTLVSDQNFGSGYPFVVNAESIASLAKLDSYKQYRNEVSRNEEDKNSGMKIRTKSKQIPTVPTRFGSTKDSGKYERTTEDEDEDEELETGEPPNTPTKDEDFRIDDDDEPSIIGSKNSLSSYSFDEPDLTPQKKRLKREIEKAEDVAYNSKCGTGILIMGKKIDFSPVSINKDEFLMEATMRSLQWEDKDNEDNITLSKILKEKKKELEDISFNQSDLFIFDEYNNKTDIKLKFKDLVCRFDLNDFLPPGVKIDPLKWKSIGNENHVIIPYREQVLNQKEIDINNIKF